LVVHWQRDVAYMIQRSDEVDAFDTVSFVWS
jgi:hypothetical protein